MCDLNCGKDEHSVLHHAVKNNSVSIVNYLLDNKVSKSSKGFTVTPLHLAAESNHEECVELLLQDAVLVDAMNNATSRETALHLAASNGHIESARLLLKSGADPNARNGRQETPLHLACKVIASPVVRLLIEYGTNLDSQDADGRPPLHCAINSKQTGAQYTVLFF